MKFSRNLLSKIIDISDISDEVIYKTLNNIGLEVESLVSFSVPKGVVVGKVIDKRKHENADKLSVCKVDIGSEVLQIVCGAKNVDKNQFVPVATIGTKLEKITIKKGNLRGVESQGMICSTTEIGLPKIEDGIFVLDESLGELTLGKELCEYEIFNDSIFEIAITPNRGDCFSLLGVAMDLSVALNVNLKSLTEKEKNSEIAPGIGRILHIQHENNLNVSLCYKVAQIKDLQNTAELRLNLAINDLLSSDSLHNIIAFSTYMTGVLINAYAFDSFMGSDDKIILQIKRDEMGVESVFFGDKKLSQIGINSVINADSDSHLVVFEASFIPPSVIAEAIFNNSIKSESNASYLAKRGSSPLLEDGINYLSHLICKMSQSTIYSSTQGILQEYPQRRIDFHFDEISAIIGNEIKNDEITAILKKMNFIVSVAADDSLVSANPPRYRHDINSVQDIAEEILRLKGIDLVQSKAQILPQSANINDDYRFYGFKRDIAKKAIAMGFFESLHYVFYERGILESYKLPVVAENLDLLNPITNELNTLRTSLLPALLDSIKRNENYGFEKVALFEIGSIYDANRAESQSLAFATNLCKCESKYPTPKGKEWDFYSFAERLSDILGGFELENCAKSSGESKGDSHDLKGANLIKSKGDLFHKGICAIIIKNSVPIGIIGKLNPYIADKLEIKGAFICEVDLDALFRANPPLQFKAFSKYQDSSREFSILVDKNVKFSAIKRAILGEKFPHIAQIIALDRYESAEFGDKVSISFKITFQSLQSTLKAEDLGDDKIIKFLSDTFGAEIR